MELNSIFNLTNNTKIKETIAISYYIINYCKNKNIEITNLKLNKLLYFINIDYMLNNNGIPIFEEEFLAWRHGPVLESVYNYFCFGIVSLVSDNLTYNLSNLKIQTINKVLDKKANMSAWELVELTHVTNGPWDIVYRKNKDVNGICKANIPNELIYNFYKGRNNEI